MPCLTTRPRASDAVRRSTRPQRREPSRAPQPPQTQLNSHLHSKLACAYTFSDVPVTHCRRAKKLGVACPLQWLPVMLGVHDPVPSGSRVVTTHDAGDVDDGTPHRDLTSHKFAKPTPAEIRSHTPPSSASSDSVRPLSSIVKDREMIAWWTSSALLCALLCAYVFNGKVATSLLLRAACTPLRPALCYTLCTSRHSRTLHLSP